MSHFVTLTWGNKKNLLHYSDCFPVYCCYNFLTRYFCYYKLSYIVTSSCYSVHVGELRSNLLTPITINTWHISYTFDRYCILQYIAQCILLKMHYMSFTHCLVFFMFLSLCLHSGHFVSVYLYMAMAVLTVGLGMYHPWILGDYCLLQKFQIVLYDIFCLPLFII